MLPQSLTETLFSYVVRRAGGRDPNTVREAVMMTPREREVVALIAAGHSNKEIADRLHIAVHTVKCHVHAVLEKLALQIEKVGDNGLALPSGLAVIRYEAA